jgi:nicotinamidase/pyrazinamidase
MQTLPTDLLLVIDVQNSFFSGGSMAVADAEVIPIINRLAHSFNNVVLTQEWHPRGHLSFASSHPGRKPFETIELPYGPQVLWPDHCVQDSEGAQLHRDLDIPHAQLVLRKGFHPDVDSYSAFVEADRKTPTGLASYLRERGIRRICCAGLATDTCVAWSAIDARQLGFESFVVEDACRATNDEGSLVRAWSEMEAVGVRRILAAETARPVTHPA